jgi:hypothetical protein
VADQLASGSGAAVLDAPFPGVQMIGRVDFGAQRDILSRRYACFRSEEISHRLRRGRGWRG